MIDETLAVLSHELKTPLSSISAAVDALLGGVPLDEAQRERFLRIIQEESRRLTRMVRDLTVSARDEVGAPPVSEEVDLEQLIRDAVMVFEPVTNDSNVLVECRLHGRDERLRHMRGDPDRLKQVMENLIANALRHSPPGSTIAVQLESTHMRTGPLTVPVAKVSVMDQGPGVDPLHLSSIFEKFRRLETGVRHTQGLGLGLYICRRIVEAHGGQIRAFNRPEGGAVISWTMPIRD